MTEHQGNITEQREKVLKMMDDKNKLETEIRMLQSVLEQNGVGMDDPLVDNQGFPRNDIDVYRVRHARHSIICLRNDLKVVMKSIEEGLHLVHAATNGVGTADFNLNNSNNVNDVNTEPIARIKAVLSDSPAFISGLQADDLVIEFGSVNSNNFKALEDISRVVQHSINSTVHLIIQRGHSRLPLQLCPKQWSGRGLLGCTILPVENIER
ncbi:26S proteasome non-ATPase regulatory subunit 9 [Lycorma delicatula]|uniref:26S proteasome non-ATPase regulatory subunit 9 n=1 Tax=Lycorma delicatula TaxID=130591 RepID=UPI003F51829A